MRSPRALNAGTTYGVDQSAWNNYGLGRSYRSQYQQQYAAKAQSAQPSMWWAIGFVFLVWVVL